MKTVSQVAKQFDVKENTVYTWIREGKLNVTRLGSGQRPRVRISEEQINEFMQA